MKEQKRIMDDFQVIARKLLGRNHRTLPASDLEKMYVAMSAFVSAIISLTESKLRDTATSHRAREFLAHASKDLAYSCKTYLHGLPANQKGRSREGVALFYLFTAIEWMGAAKGVLGEEMISSNKRKAWAEIRHASDPKQLEKSFILDCWKSWQANPERYKSKAAFARDMLTKCEHLNSQKKIEDWCREWERNAGILPA